MALGGHGPAKFEDVRSFNGITFQTFKEACVARGMLADAVLTCSRLCAADRGQLRPSAAVSLRRESRQITAEHGSA